MTQDFRNLIHHLEAYFDGTWIMNEEAGNEGGEENEEENNEASSSHSTTVMSSPRMNNRRDKIRNDIVVSIRRK